MGNVCGCVKYYKLNFIFRNSFIVGNNVFFSGNGACLSLRQVAELTYAPDGSLANFVYTTPWDAE